MRGLHSALVIDSDPIWLSTVERGLRSYGFHKVKCATTLSDAWQSLTGDESLIVTEVVVAHEACFGFVSQALARNRALVVAMSDHAPRPHVFRLQECGVKAYLEKPFATPVLHRCLETLAQGSLVRGLLSQGGEDEISARQIPVIEDVLHEFRNQFRLTNAETDVLRALMGGTRRMDVARERCISINTVKTQVRSLLSKSGASSIRSLRRVFMDELRRHATASASERAAQNQS